MCSVLSDSLWRHGLQPTSLLCSWDFPGKNTRVGWHFCLQGIFPIQGLNLHLMHLLNWQANSLLPAPPGMPLYFVVSTIMFHSYVISLGNWASSWNRWSKNFRAVDSLKQYSWFLCLMWNIIIIPVLYHWSFGCFF